jgi:hypothetical protein
LRAGLIAVPFGIGPFPKDVPDSLATHVPHSGDGLLNVLTGTLESGAHQEKINRLAGEALALTHLVTQVQGRTPSRPKQVFDHFYVFSDLGVSKGHGKKTPVSLATTASTLNFQVSTSNTANPERPPRGGTRPTMSLRVSTVFFRFSASKVVGFSTVFFECGVGNL